jgi:F-type H+-transporting ATPase subunit gamma
MEMVAASKLRRFEDLFARAKPGADFLERLTRNLLSGLGGYLHPLITERPVTKSTLIVATSDTGLCGTYNSNVLHETLRFLRENPARPVEIIAVGKFGLNSLTHQGARIYRGFTELRLSNFEAMSLEVARHAKEQFLHGETDEVLLVYTHYVSRATHVPRIARYLPLARPAAKQEQKIEYILEPDAETVLAKVLPRFLDLTMKLALIEASLSEQIARMLAMKQATDNAEEMIDDLTLLRNKLRQAAITKELIEVVSGARALVH